MIRKSLNDGKVMFEYKGGFIIWQPWDGYVNTTFNDSISCVGTPNFGESDYALASELGYKGVQSTKLMSEDHEILHTFISEKSGLDHSPTLWAAAHSQEKKVPLWKQLEEEAVVLGFQKFINRGVEDKYLIQWAKVTNNNIVELVEEYKTLKEG
jgi:hypothetical protein